MATIFNETADKLLSRLRELREQYNGTSELGLKLKSVRFDRDTTECIDRFMDELQRIKGGREEIERRSAVLTHSEYSTRILATLSAIREDLVALQESIVSRPRRPLLAPWPDLQRSEELQRRIALRKSGNGYLATLVEFGEFVEASENGLAPLTIVNIQNFQWALGRVLKKRDWPMRDRQKDELFGQLQIMQEHAKALYNDADHDRSEGCMWLLAIASRESRNQIDSLRRAAQPPKVSNLAPETPIVASCPRGPYPERRHERRHTDPAADQIARPVGGA